MPHARETLATPRQRLQDISDGAKRATHCVTQASAPGNPQTSNRGCPGHPARSGLVLVHHDGRPAFESAPRDSQRRVAANTPRGVDRQRSREDLLRVERARERRADAPNASTRWCSTRSRSLGGARIPAESGRADPTAAARRRRSLVIHGKDRRRCVACPRDDVPLGSAVPAHRRLRGLVRPHANTTRPLPRAL